MGKYDNSIDTPTIEQIIQIKLINELAESNRLKRIELKYYLVVNGMNAKEVKEDANLEDQV